MNQFRKGHFAKVKENKRAVKNAAVFLATERLNSTVYS
jgi:hypothetical protein